MTDLQKRLRRQLYLSIALVCIMAASAGLSAYRVVMVLTCCPEDGRPDSLIYDSLIIVFASFVAYRGYRTTGMITQAMRDLEWRRK